MTDSEARDGRKPFVPPPWEQERFDELARRRAAEEQKSTSAPEDESVTEVPASPHAAVRASAPQLPQTDQRVVDAMLVQLSGEEPPALSSVRKLMRAAAVVVLVVGVALLVFGIVLATRVAGSGNSGPAGGGVFGSMIIVAFGALVSGSAIWLWVRADGGKGS